MNEDGNEMTRTTRHLMVGMMMTGLLGAGRPATATGVDDAPAVPRVRSSHASIVRAIKQASERSKTFRGLVESINASDGTVYVQEGQCGHGVRTCLVTVTMAGANRNLWVKVDTRLRDWDLMGFIGHELQHVIEVLSDRTVTSGPAMYFFYQRKGSFKGATFETDAAIEAGEAVRTEARKFSPRRRGQVTIPGLQCSAFRSSRRQFELFFAAASAATFS